MVLALENMTPLIAPTAWVAPNATVVADVHLGEGSSVWFGAVVRGDVFHVRIGRDTNVQDNAVIHVTTGKHPTLVGDGVTIGHSATLHGCTVEDRALVGIGSIIMDRAVVGQEAIIGAGSLVTPGTVIPPGTLAVGSPCRVKRPLSPDELQFVRESGRRYAELAARYRAGMTVVG